MITATIDLASSWSSFWASVSGPAGNIVKLLGTLGMLLIVFGVVMYFWERRRGNGDTHSKLLWTLLVGGILAGPDIFIPTLLTLIDFAINAGASGLHGQVGG